MIDLHKSPSRPRGHMTLFSLGDAPPVDLGHVPKLSNPKLSLIIPVNVKSHPPFRNLDHLVPKYICRLEYCQTYDALRLSSAATTSIRSCSRTYYVMSCIHVKWSNQQHPFLNAVTRHTSIPGLLKAASIRDNPSFRQTTASSFLLTTSRLEAVFTDRSRPIAIGQRQNDSATAQQHMWTIHQPKARAASPQKFYFLNDPPDNPQRECRHQHQHQLPTPSSSPDPRPPARRLTIPDLVSSDEHFGKVNTLHMAADILAKAAPLGDAVLAFDEAGEGEYILSARPWEVGECRRASQELWDRLDGPEGAHSRHDTPSPPRGPAVQPVALSYLTPPSSPEPHKSDLAPVVHSGPPNAPEPTISPDSTDIADVFDHPVHYTSTYESAEYISDLDDAFEEDDECASESSEIPTDGFLPHRAERANSSSSDWYKGSNMFINSEKPDSPSVAMGLPPYDVSIMHSPTIKDLTPQLDLSKFSEWPIARGGFGEVWKGALVSDVKDSRPVAVKRLTMYTAAGDEGIIKTAKRTNRELSIWSGLNHPNILPLLGACTFRGGIGIVSEWQGNGNAVEWINAHPGVNRLDLVCQSLLPWGKANVLISKSGRPRLIDFGLASATNGNPFSASSTLAGTLRWMAPELQVTEQQGATATGDIFAFGMTTSCSVDSRPLRTSTTILRCY
ncbi:Pkinase domain-containing protein [Rhizoctonia solani AG-1 IA]|uniref:Pkinase domain-containing protein n=1 Tax=Thanatephorus cucumeris (strain AG1-IA) TaxID=983506 RepID=L8WR60_THACA|nr:Pkinase domain-containing protein [Rhizoctonia solani AG-1 IA]